jgi:hypothetical protein
MLRGYWQQARIRIPLLVPHSENTLKRAVLLCSNYDAIDNKDEICAERTLTLSAKDHESKTSAHYFNISILYEKDPSGPAQYSWPKDV